MFITSETHHWKFSLLRFYNLLKSERSCFSAHYFGYAYQPFYNEYYYSYMQPVFKKLDTNSQVNMNLPDLQVKKNKLQHTVKFSTM